MFVQSFLGDPETLVSTAEADGRPLEPLSTSGDYAGAMSITISYQRRAAAVPDRRAATGATPDITRERVRALHPQSQCSLRARAELNLAGVYLGLPAD